MYVRESKVDFGLVFIICLIITIFNEIWSMVDKIPELFKHGDIIYHIIKSGISIINNIAVSIAAAIIFYYAVEFLGKKKNYEMYTDIRKNILFMFYKHLKVLTKLDWFSEIITRERRVPDFYDIFDVPVLVKLFKEISTEEEVLIIKNELNNFFQIQNKNFMVEFADSFKKDIAEIKNKMNYRYFKESKDLIEAIYIQYDDEFLITSERYAFEKDKENISTYIDTIVDDYFDFLNSTIVFYIKLEKFINCIDKKQLGVFIRMLD